MHKPRRTIIQTMFFIMIIITSCSRNEPSTNNTEAKFDEMAITADIINQTLPILIPDSSRLMSSPFYSVQIDEKISDQEYELAIKNYNELIDSVGMALNLDGSLFIPDSSDVKWILKKGASKVFEKYSSDFLSEKIIDLSQIDNYGRVQLTSLYPQTSSEMDRYYGFSSYSRMIFHSNNNKAIFFFNTSLFRSCLSFQSHAIEVELIDNKWEIIYNSRANEAY